MNTNTLDRLARLRVQAGRGEPFRRHLERIGVALELPAPEATALALDPFSGSTLYRKGSTVVLEDGSAPSWRLEQVAERIVESWADLPDRDDAGRSYGELRLVSREARGVALEYALLVLGAWRSTLEPAPKKENPRRREQGERTPDRDRKRSSRERLREDEETSSRWWLDGLVSGRWTGGEAPAEGSRITASVAHRKASREIWTAVEEREETLSGTPPTPEADEALDDFRERLRAWEEREGSRTPEDRLQEWEDYADEEDLPLRPRVPGRSLFYGVADEVLGKRRTIHGRSVYTIGGNVNTITRDEIDEAIEVRELVQVLRDHKRRHETKRDAGGRFTAPAADGTVVPLFG